MPRTELDIWNLALARLGDFRISPETSKTVSSATAANPIVCTSTAHGYAAGELVLLADFDELTQVNGRVFEISAADANTFALSGEDGSAGVAESSGGTVRRLPSQKHIQQAYLHWSLCRDEVLREHPWNCAEKQTRLARLATATNITGITAANPAVVTSAAHGYSNGDLVLVDGVVGMVEVNGRYYTVGSADTNTYALSGEDSSDYAAYSSGGTARKALQPLRNDHGWTYRYDQPSDYLRQLEAVNSQASWQPVGVEIHSDDGPTVPIRYIRRLTDPARFDPLLVSALASRLAVDLVERLASPSGSKKQELKDAARELLLKAKGVDAQEHSVDEPAISAWEAARL